jgi:hypothetical protein
MEKAETPTSEAKRSPGISTLILWSVATLLLYILSTGPVIMLIEKKRLKEDGFVETFYAPIGWLDDNTPLGRPLRVYWHLWAPKMFDKNENLILL